jgi:tetratricopeptide (TPR) repeat protein
MPSSKFKFATILGATILLVPSMVFAQAKIVFKNGNVQNVDKISSATYKKVVYRLGGSPQNYDASEIQDVYPGSRNLGSGLQSLKAGKIKTALTSFKAASRSNDDKQKAFGLFFLGRIQQRIGQTREAAKSYQAMVQVAPEHFYAPESYYQAGECLRYLGKFKDAESSYKALSKFGSAWKDKGSYGRAVALLAQGSAKAGQALSEFSKLTRAADPVGGLAKVGVARAMILQGNVSGARGKISSLIDSAKKSPAVQGGGFLALGDAELADKKNKSALFAYLRSALLYGGESSFVDARQGAAKAMQTMNSRVAGRIRGLPARNTYTGAKPNAEFVRMLMQTISVSLAKEKAEELLKTVVGAEKADIEFLRADALNAIGKKDEYKKLIGELQKKYPTHARAGDVKADLVFSAMSDLTRRWKEAKDESDSTKRKALADKIHAEYKQLIADFKKLVVEANAQCKAIDELEDMRKKYVEVNIKKLRRRDTFELKFGEMIYAASQTYVAGDPDRNSLLDKAFKVIDDFTLDRGENYSFDLLANAYKTKGLILLDQDKADDAVLEFEGLKEYVAPIQVRDKNVMAQVKEFEKSIRISGYRLFAKACSKAGKNEEAIKAFEELEKNFPNYKNTREGLLAMFELTKCLAGAGRTTEALEQIYPIVEDPKSIKVQGISSDNLRIEACKALAGISDAAGGEIFPPEVQFQVGLGYKIRGDDEAAIVGYKGVLTSAITKEDRKKWVPKAVEEMGILLYYQQRYLEAVLAYRVLFTEFPTHPKASDAIKFARTAMNKALKDYGESELSRGPLMALKKELDRALVTLGGGLAGATVILKEAAKLQIARRYVQAAEKYLEVPETSEVKDEETKKKKTIPVPFFPNAVANAGYCYFKAYEAEKNGDHLKLATDYLQKSLSVAKKLDDDKSYALASYYLGELHNFKKEFKKAVDYLKPFDGKFKNMKNFKIRAKGQQVEAFLALDESAEAEARYKAVAAESDVGVTIMALDLADWFARAAGKASEGKKPIAMVRAYQAKAADYASDWISKSKKLKRNSLLWASSLIMDGGKYDKATKVYERLFNEFPRPKVVGNLIGNKARVEMDLHDQYDLAELNLARAYMIAGDSEKAEKLFARLQKLVIVKKKGSLKARGEFVKLKRENLKNANGRPVRCKVFTIKSGDSEKFYMVPPRQSPPNVVPGRDASQTYGKRDFLTLRQRFKSNFLVLEGLAEASWGVYKKNGDKKYLAIEVQAAWNTFYNFLDRVLDESRYKDSVKNFNIKEKRYGEKLMSVALRLLEIRYEREMFKEIIGDIELFEKMGKLKSDFISPKLKRKILSLQTKAKKK